MIPMHRILLLLALFPLAACQSVNTSAEARNIATRGVGEVSVAPDQAEIAFEIEERSRDLAESRSAAEQAVGKLLKLASELGIASEQVDSTGILIRPEYSFHEGERQFVGYYVSRRVRVTLYDLALLGPLTDGAFQAGINAIGSPSLSVSNPREHYRKALELAAEDAHANAQILAATLDARVGKVQSISEAGSTGRPPLEREFRMSMATAEGETNMQAGRIRFSATVEARFELLN